MTSQLPCKQEGWNSLPMILVWLLRSWSASQSELMYPHKNFKARKDRQCHWTERKLRCTGLSCEWLWHLGWIKAPQKYWVQQSKWLALSAEGRLQFKGGRQTHLSTSCVHSLFRYDQLTLNHFCRNESDGFSCLLPHLMGVHFFTALGMTCWRWQSWGRLLLNTATLSFLMRMGCMERGLQVLQVKKEDKIVQREKKKKKSKTKAAVRVCSKRCGW